MFHLQTGIHLVKEMIWIAEGKPLSIKQEDLKINGHSIEIRVSAEDPKNNFLPNRVTFLQIGYKYQIIILKN